MTKRARSDSEEKPRGARPSPSPPPAMAEVTLPPTIMLSNLLDMSHIAPGNEPAHFETIANTLMQQFRLCVADQSDPPKISSYEFLEVEFYWYSPATGHIDPFTHAAEEQRVSGNWYFHRAPRRVPPNSQSTAPVPSPKTSGFKGGSRKGLDLTFGTVPPKAGATPAPPVAYGGILLRALRNTSTQKVTCGPSLLVDEVLRAAGTDSLPHLVGTLWSGDTCAFLGDPDDTPKPGQMFLRAAGEPKTTKFALYTSPRIGLELSRIGTPGEATPNHPRVQYVVRPYRFFTHPKLLGSVRPQTFYGLFTKYEAGDISRSQIADALGMKPMQVETFAGYIAEGKRAGQGGIKEFVGEKGKGAAPSTQRFLKMAGVLECVLGKEVQAEGSAAKKQKLGKTLTGFFASSKSS